MGAVEHLTSLGHSSVSACAALSVPRSSYYRSAEQAPIEVAPRGLHPSSLTVVSTHIIQLSPGPLVDGWLLRAA